MITFIILDDISVFVFLELVDGVAICIQFIFLLCIAVNFLNRLLCSYGYIGHIKFCRLFTFSVNVSPIVILKNLHAFKLKSVAFRIRNKVYTVLIYCYNNGSLKFVVIFIIVIFYNVINSTLLEVGSFKACLNCISRCKILSSRVVCVVCYYSVVICNTLVYVAYL